MAIVEIVIKLIRVDWILLIRNLANPSHPCAKAIFLVFLEATKAQSYKNKMKLIIVAASFLNILVI